MTAPVPFEILAWHKKDDAVMMRVPDADLFGSGASAAGHDNSVVILAQNEDRIGKPGCLQPWPIELGMFGLETECRGQFDNPRERDGLATKVTTGFVALDRALRRFRISIGSGTP